MGSAVLAMKPADPKPYLKIGDVARLVGVSPSVIRTWESLGVTRPHRTTSKYRLYTPEDVKLLKRARFLRKVRGLNAPAIAQTAASTRRRLVRPAATERRERRHRSWGTPAPDASCVEACPFGSSGQRRVGISVGFLSALERSHMSASVSTLRKLARFYKTKILEFYTSDAAESNSRLVPSEQAQSPRGGTRRPHGTAGVGKHRDGTAFVSHVSPRAGI